MSLKVCQIFCSKIIGSSWLLFFTTRKRKAAADEADSGPAAKKAKPAQSEEEIALKVRSQK